MCSHLIGRTGIHGFWVTPRSWEEWISRYEGRGYTVIAPAYPGFEVEVEALNADPAPVEALTRLGDHRPARIAHRTARCSADPDGSFGRRRVHAGRHGSRIWRCRRRDELSSDGGGASRAAGSGEVNLPGPQEPRQSQPGGPLHIRAVALRIHEHIVLRRGVPEALRAVRGPGVGTDPVEQRAGEPGAGAQDVWVNYKNPDRAPLLFISGSEDHLMPPRVQASNAKHYKGAGTVDRGEGVRRPTPAPCEGPGWEEVADYALEWAMSHVKEPTAAGATTRAV